MFRDWFMLIILTFTTDEICSLGSLPRCPHGWTLNGHSCWMSMQELRVSMSKAQQACERLGSHLVVPNSQAENDFVLGAFQKASAGLEIQRLWIGCTAVLPNNTLSCFESITGPNEWNYSFKESNATNKRCVGMSHKNGKWYAGSCARRRYVMCEKAAQSVTAGSCIAVSPTENSHTGNYCLLDHALYTTQIKSPVQCCIACIKNQSCLSFNLSGNTCQLNNATIDQVDKEKYLTQEKSCGYFEMELGWQN